MAVLHPLRSDRLLSLIMEHRPTVSVVIPAYNSSATLDIVISKLVEQTHFDRIKEIIIVDSSDDKTSKKQLSSFSHRKIRIVHSGKNRIMPAKQRNTGAKLATGDIIVFLDSDTYPERTYLAKVLKAYSNGHMIGGGSINIPDFQTGNKVVRAQYYLYCNEFMCHGTSRQMKLLPSANLFCDRMLFIKSGGFPEIRASEDSLFTRLISEHRANLIFVPEAKVFHIFRETREDLINGQYLSGKYIYIYRKLLFDSIYLRSFCAPMLLPAFILMKFGRISYRIMRTGIWHSGQYVRLIPLIIIGLVAWGRGFKNGIMNFKQENLRLADTLDHIRQQ